MEEGLIATIPDPNDTRLTYLFERHLDAILVALAMEGYVRDREVPLFRSTAANSGSTLGVILLRPEPRRSRGRSDRPPLLVLTSQDAEKNGLFTGTLKEVWNKGFKGGYRKFHKAILAKMPPTQTPNFFRTGAVSVAFERSTPFTI